MTSPKSSEANPLRVDWIDPFYVPLVMHAGGRLGMTLLPGKRSPGGGQHRRDLNIDVDALRHKHGCDTLVVLTAGDELRELGLSVLPTAVSARHIEYITHRVVEGGVPDDREVFRRLCDRLIRQLLRGGTVVVASRHGRGRAGLLVACLLRDLGDYEPAAAIEFVWLFREGMNLTTAQTDFVSNWVWPRRPAVARALRQGRKQKAAEQAALEATLPPDRVTFDRLWMALRKVLWTEDLMAAYVVEPTPPSPARIVCFLVEPRDPERAIARVRRCARRYVRPTDFEVILGPVNVGYPVLHRIVPAPPPRLGE